MKTNADLRGILVRSTKEIDDTFAGIREIIDKSTIFHSMGANELIGQLNAIFVNHKTYIEKDNSLSDTDKASLIEEATFLTLDTVNCISALREIFEEYEKYKIRTKIKT
uniref:hypothetical protein n=1 Tax=uncultured Dysgonomonas sp. TaxID=206096 RepID=UPI0026366288|nr:hypothetical protein [uncultured Dysgonomonas sp.]